MLVKLTTARFGHNTKTLPSGEKVLVGMFAHAPGAEVEMPDDEAQRYVERGLAEPVEDRKSARAK